jgi:hypothetical protein
MVLPLHCCRAIVYFVLLSTIVSNKYHENVSVFLPWLSCTKFASFLRRTQLASVACLALQYFSTLSHKRNDFRKKTLFPTNLSEIFLILRRIQRDIFINVQRTSFKVPVILVTYQ